MENIKDRLRLYTRVLSFLLIDGISVVLASFLTLLIRTEFVMNVELWNNYMSVFYYDILITLCVYSLFNLYRSLWQFASMVEMRRLIVSTLVANFVKMFVYGVLLDVMLPKSWYVMNALILFMFTCGSRFLYRNIRSFRNDMKLRPKLTGVNRVMIIGAGEAGNILLREIILSEYLKKKVVCFIDDDISKIGSYMKGVPIVGGRNTII